jgi:hypothetical protein
MMMLQAQSLAHGSMHKDKGLKNMQDQRLIELTDSIQLDSIGSILNTTDTVMRMLSTHAFRGSLSFRTSIDMSNDAFLHPKHQLQLHHCNQLAEISLVQ